MPETVVETAAVNVNILLFKNRYNSLKFVIDGVANLSGWTARYTISSSPGGSALIDKNTSNDISFSGVEVYVDIWPANTASISAGTNYYHELTLIDNESNPRVAAYGDDCEIRDVTDIS